MNPRGKAPIDLLVMYMDDCRMFKNLWIDVRQNFGSGITGLVQETLWSYIYIYIYIVVIRIWVQEFLITSFNIAKCLDIGVLLRANSRMKSLDGTTDLY